jgi:hypothetical protein
MTAVEASWAGVEEEARERRRGGGSGRVATESFVYQTDACRSEQLLAPRRRGPIGAPQKSFLCERVRLRATVRRHGRRMSDSRGYWRAALVLERGLTSAHRPGVRDVVL